MQSREANGGRKAGAPNERDFSKKKAADRAENAKRTLTANLKPRLRGLKGSCCYCWENTAAAEARLVPRFPMKVSGPLFVTGFSTVRARTVEKPVTKRGGTLVVSCCRLVCLSHRDNSLSVSQLSSFEGFDSAARLSAYSLILPSFSPLPLPMPPALDSVGCLLCLSHLHNSLSDSQLSSFDGFGSCVARLSAPSLVMLSFPRLPRTLPSALGSVIQQ